MSIELMFKPVLKTHLKSCCGNYVNTFPESARGPRGPMPFCCAIQPPMGQGL